MQVATRVANGALRLEAPDEAHLVPLPLTPRLYVSFQLIVVAKGVANDGDELFRVRTAGSTDIRRHHCRGTDPVFSIHFSDRSVFIY